MHVKIFLKKIEVIKLITFEVGNVTITIPDVYNNIMSEFDN